MLRMSATSSAQASFKDLRGVLFSLLFCVNKNAASPDVCGPKVENPQYETFFGDLLQKIGTRSRNIIFSEGQVSLAKTQWPKRDMVDKPFLDYLELVSDAVGAFLADLRDFGDTLNVTTNDELDSVHDCLSSLRSVFQVS